MDAVAQNTGRRVGEPLTERFDAGTGHTAASQGRDGTLRGDAPAWRAAGVGAAFGLAAVVWSLQDRLAEWSAIGGAAAFMALGIVVAVANQALVSRYMTGRRQPDPEPVPLG